MIIIDSGKQFFTESGRSKCFQNSRDRPARNNSHFEKFISEEPTPEGAGGNLKQNPKSEISAVNLSLK